jgi:L-ribulokinase
VYPDIQAAAQKMGSLKGEVVQPIPANQKIYDQLYADYRTLYDYFGRGQNDVMKRLKRLKREVRGD